MLVFSHRHELQANSTSFLDHNLVRLQSYITEWNRTNFGNIFWRKRRLLASIRGYPSGLVSTTMTLSFLSLGSNLIQENHHTLYQEFLFWELKSKIAWINFGDANTKFLHIFTINNRNRKSFSTLRDSSGKWLANDLRTHILKIYKSFFTTNSSHRSIPSKLRTPIQDSNLIKDFRSALRNMQHLI